MQPAILRVILGFGVAAFAWHGWAAEPETLSQTVNVLDFGARGDGQQDDAPAIQKALDSSAPVVVIPRGTFRISHTLLIGSNTTLKADPEAVIRLADDAGNDPGVFLLTNQTPDDGNVQITVEGGVWDGNNEHNCRTKNGRFFGYTGTAINFINVKNLTIRKLTIRNPEAYSIRLGEVEDFLVEDIRFDHAMLRPNQDGVHVGGFSQRGVIRRLKAITPNSTSDDMVALNADDDVDRAGNLGMRRGPIRDILVEDLEAENVHNFVRILSNESPIENITVRRVKGGCQYYAVNLNQWRFAVGSGKIRHVTLEQFEVSKTQYKDRSSPGLIHITLNVQDLHIRDLHRIANPQTAEAATLLLKNQRDNRIRQGDGPEQTLQEFSVPSGDIGELWINPTQ